MVAVVEGHPGPDRPAANPEGPGTQPPALTSALSAFHCRIEFTEFDAGIGGGELPVDLASLGVGGLLPGCEFDVEAVDVGDAPVEALP